MHVEIYPIVYIRVVQLFSSLRPEQFSCCKKLLPPYEHSDEAFGSVNGTEVFD